MFVDQVRIHVKAGDGGNGCASFRREKFVPRGGPDGGDGGRGGDVVFAVDPHTDNLVSLYFQPIIRAKHGGNGKGKQKHGKSAPKVVVKVPAGTLIFRLPDHLGANVPPDPEKLVEEPSPSSSGRKIDPANLELVADLLKPGEEFVLCEGGRGGKGNIHFKNSINRAPRQFTEGTPGGEGHFFLELRRIADAGLVGYPNAGKSTLLSRISAAHPKVAPYPFTTLNPVVGVVQLDAYRRITVADIPGLIEGAHRNIGLGHEFLRHIVRCRLLLFVLDMAGSEGREPGSDYASLRRELKLYDPALATRPWIVVANKMDLPEAAEKLAAFRAQHPDVEVVPVAAEPGDGLDLLKERLGALAEGPAQSVVADLPE
jgi:GTP-binding protein